jgi:hypothetical protein
MNRRVLVGLGLLCAGGALLLVTTGVLTIGALILPLLLLIVGVLLFWRAILPSGRDSNAFAGTVLALTGGFWVLWESALPAVTASTIWPVFMTIVGIALVVYGVKKGDEYKLTLVTPGVAIVILSVVFMLFSLDIIEASLARVAAVWWPILLVVIGVMILVLRSDGESNASSLETADADEDLIPRRKGSEKR